MRKFICIFILALVSFIASAQYNTNYQRFFPKSKSQQEEIDALKNQLNNFDKWQEWSTAQRMEVQGKNFIRSGIAVGTIATGVGLIYISTNNQKIAAGQEFYERDWADGSSVHLSYNTINSRIRAGMVVVDAMSLGAVLWGLYQRNRGRKELDRIYSNVYFNGRTLSVNF